MARGAPGERRGPNADAQQEFERRGELVRSVLWLRRGQIEDLELLVRHRQPGATRSEVVRGAVTWLLAREAMALIRARGIDARKAEVARLEAEALAVSRQEREARDQEHELENALAIARGGHSQDGTIPASAAKSDALRQAIDALR
jgi:hypothetical protein